jgi:predicted RNase H-like HicB family nuclease
MALDVKYVIFVTWDTEAAVWVAESTDIPGLATEAPTMESLLVKLEVMVPELLELNLGYLPGPIPIQLHTEHVLKAAS